MVDQRQDVQVEFKYVFSEETKVCEEEVLSDWLRTGSEIVENGIAEENIFGQNLNRIISPPSPNQFRIINILLKHQFDIV